MFIPLFLDSLQDFKRRYRWTFIGVVLFVLKVPIDSEWN